MPLYNKRIVTTKTYYYFEVMPVSFITITHGYVYFLLVLGFYDIYNLKCPNTLLKKLNVMQNEWKFIKRLLLNIRIQPNNQ